MTPGSVFGRWTLLARVSPPGTHHPRWLCRCACGTQRDVDVGAIRRGKSTSCGCAEFASKSTTHGLSRSPILGVWRNIISRCTKVAHASYADYGGRGISVCPRWLSLADFVADVGPHPGGGLTFERKDNDGNYEPGNVCWASRAEQARNKRSTRLVTVSGDTKCVQDWATTLGVTANHLYRRVRAGMAWPEAIADIRENPPRVRGTRRISNNNNNTNKGKS